MTWQDAITGIPTDEDTALSKSRSYPFLFPSRSIQFNISSPIPLDSSSFARVTGDFMGRPQYTVQIVLPQIVFCIDNS